MSQAQADTRNGKKANHYLNLRSVSRCLGSIKNFVNLITSSVSLCEFVFNACSCIYRQSHFQIKSPQQIQGMREACARARDILMESGEAVKPGVTTDYIDRVAHEGLSL